MSALAGPVDQVESGEVVGEGRRPSAVQELRDEQLDLYLRLELLADAKRAFNSGNREECDEIKKRLGEIKGELAAIAAGTTYEPPSQPEPKQERLPFSEG